MSDRLLSYKCNHCQKNTIDFDPPETCPHCNKNSGFSEYFGNIGTRLASEGIMCEFVLDNNHEYDIRNDKWTEQYLEEQAMDEISKVRSDRIESDPTGKALVRDEAD